MFEAVRDERALKKIARLLVLVRSFPAIHLAEVRRELGLLEASACNIRMRRDDFAPRLQTLFWLPLGWRERQLSSLSSRLLVESDAQQFLLASFDLGGLLGRDRAEESLHAIERTIGIICGK